MRSQAQEQVLNGGGLGQERVVASVELDDGAGAESRKIRDVDDQDLSRVAALIAGAWQDTPVAGEGLGAGDENRTRIISLEARVVSKACPTGSESHRCSANRACGPLWS